MKSRVFLPAAFLLLAWAPGAGAQSAPDAAAVRAGPESPSSFGDDVALGVHLVGHGLSAPLRWSQEQWLNIPTALVILGAISPMDENVYGFARRNHGDLANGFFDAVEPLGMGYSFVLIGGLYAGGWIADEPGVRRMAVRAAAASVVAGGIATPLLKLAFGRSRPWEGVGPYQFDPFSGQESFPSGHTTQAFAVASVIAAESPHRVVDIAAYGLATAVGAARIYHEAHFLTDVLAGAAIGTVVGRTMARQGGVASASGVQPFVQALGTGEPVVGVSLRF